MRQLLLYTFGLLLVGASTAFANGSSPAAVDYGRRPSYYNGGGYSLPPTQYSSYRSSSRFVADDEDDEVPAPRRSTTQRAARSSGWHCPAGMTGSQGASSAERRSQSQARAIADAADRDNSSRGGSAGDMDPRQLEAARYALAHAHPPQDGTGLCVIGVKNALVKVGLLKAGGYGNAVAYKDVLGNRCFSNAIGRYPTPGAAPEGAILVYRGVNLHGDKNAYAGHIEFKFHGEYVSDYYSPRPRTGSGGASVGRNRQLIGVMIKRKGSCS